MNVSVEMQTSTRWAVLFVRLCGVLHWLGISRLIGIERLNDWAIRGCYRLCYWRMRFRGKWSKWQRVYPEWRTM